MGEVVRRVIPAGKEFRWEKKFNPKSLPRSQSRSLLSPSLPRRKLKSRKFKSRKLKNSNPSPGATTVRRARKESAATIAEAATVRATIVLVALAEIAVEIAE